LIPDQTDPPDEQSDVAEKLGEAAVRTEEIGMDDPVEPVHGSEQETYDEGSSSKCLHGCTVTKPN